MLCFSALFHLLSEDCRLHSLLCYQMISRISFPRWQPQLLGLPTLLVPHKQLSFLYPNSKISSLGIQSACFGSGSTPESNQLWTESSGTQGRPYLALQGKGQSTEAHIESTRGRSLKSFSINFQCTFIEDT